jgi:hypothetical protein
MESLLQVRHLTRRGDYLFSFDLQDGFYALGIRPADRDYFTVNIRGQHYRLAGLPMGWSLSPYYFCTFTGACVRHLRSTAASPGLRLLPYVDDFIVFAPSHREALQQRSVVETTLARLGLSRHTSKGIWDPVQYGQHLGIDLDTANGYFYAPAAKLQTLANQAKSMLQRATRTARWLPVKQLLQFDGRAQYLFLAIPSARFYLRELHCTVGGI